MFLGYVLPSLLMNQILAFRSAGCTTPQKEGLVTGCYTVAQWNAYAMYELTFLSLGHHLSLSKVRQSYMRVIQAQLIA